eukprot:COSAG01_NODE_2153_length_8291_cov_6.152832_3_plen_63_part_00
MSTLLRYAMPPALPAYATRRRRGGLTLWVRRLAAEQERHPPAACVVGPSTPRPPNYAILLIL